MTPKTFDTGRLALMRETWRLRYVEHLSAAQIGERQGRSTQTIRNDLERLMDRRSLEMQALALTICCERCGVIREYGDVEGCENPNADVLCDECHEDLQAGRFYALDELLPERIAELGYNAGRWGKRIAAIHAYWQRMDAAS